MLIHTPTRPTFHAITLHSQAQQRRITWHVGLLVLATFLLPLLIPTTAQAAGLEINLTFVQSPQTPAADPNGQLVMAIMEAAASHWKSIILDNHTVDVVVTYQDIGDDRLAYACFTKPSGQCWDGPGEVQAVLPTTAAIVIDTVTMGGAPVVHYYDPTPTNHSEFDLQQVLVRDLPINTQNFLYDGDLPDLLEVSYSGDALGTAPALAQTAFDMMTIAMHELGHVLGMLNENQDTSTETGDGDFDFDSDFVFGSSMAAEIASGGDGEHLLSPNSLMAATMGPGERLLPTATDVFAVASAGGWHDIQLPRQEFWGGSFWSLPFDWAGNRRPISTTDVWVRSGDDAHMVADVALRNLTVTGDSDVLAYNHELSVQGWITVEAEPGGGDSRLWAEGDVLVPGMHIGEGGVVDVDNGHIQALLIETEADGRLAGFGNATMWALDNNGTLRADAGGPLIINTTDGSLDLDGSTGNGTAEALSGTLRLADGLSDAFDGDMTIHSDASVEVIPDWTMGTGGLLTMVGGVDGGHLARLQGGALQLNGDILASGWSRIYSDLTTSASMDVTLDADAHLSFNGTTVLAGGDVTGLGVLQFNGATTVDSWTILQPNIVDLDGSTGNTVITLDNTVLELNVEQVDRYNNVFDGTLNFDGVSARLMVHLDDPSDVWTLAGEAYTEANPFFTTTMLGGSDVRITGALEVDGMTRLAADVELSGSLTTVDVDAEVHLAGGGVNVFWQTADINGSGDVIVDAGTTLQLEHNFNDWMHLINGGDMQPGVGLGSAQVWTYAQQSSGSLNIELGGLTAGTGHDRLRAFGSIQLDGGLDVQFVNGFVPQIGDSFQLLASTFGSVSGTFDAAQINLPVLPFRGAWNIDYGIKTVTLEVVAAR